MVVTASSLAINRVGYRTPLEDASPDTWGSVARVVIPKLRIVLEGGSSHTDLVMSTDASIPLGQSEIATRDPL